MLVLLLWLRTALPEVPSQMVYCGMRVFIQPEARRLIEDQIAKFYEYPPALEALIARAETLLPYIEEALRYIGVPEDLKYLAIQESRLNPHAISRSQAVGYWQMKDFTAREVGLVVNDTIDERKHLFRSTAGAALYLGKQYARHRNWLFALIAYYEGGTGALPYIDSAYVGKNEAVLHAKTHWYALRAVAYKIAFEALIQRKVYGLRPVAYHGPPCAADQIARLHGVSLETFLAYNPWLVRPFLPGSRPSTYYLPAETLLAELPQEPVKELFLPITAAMAYASVPTGYLPPRPKSVDTLTGSPPPPPPPVPKPSPTSARSRTTFAPFALLPLQKEPYLDKEWAYPPPPLTRRLKRWNPFYTGKGPILIVPPRRAHVHIVQSQETPRAIAQHYGLRLEQLLARNRWEKADTTLPTGLRVYLRENRPYDERPIVYKW
ncbi:MAG: transglycosylase SLT domain-containing protein [Bacteroidia bacterium]|nr:transglycosylase SLT domain-containing protein [Bacteroidia bacterium]MDW8088894.1 transglycosylase SLT domain-containing protein [Bacteroidia bacterium]